ncbi:putative bifunctional diguanylate cyclase/phosphodiesterase [Comamonas aquatica]|uniref:putative bifunctional diguanylate cyclase/phosphodiesterase n=1 Tax=Comamonas aquatica TaxID=225991 RepID=UPI0021B1319F|nr:EAL domain-containing protein [Comamonas aquatica]
MPLSALPPSPTASFSALKRRCIGWANSWQPVHLALVAIVVLVLAVSWWLTGKHLRAQLAQAEQAARLQQSGLAAIVSENLSQVLEKAQLMSVVALQGMHHDGGPWQAQLAHMLERDRVFLRMAVLDKQLQLLAGDAQQAALLHSLLPYQQGSCAAGRGAFVLHQQAQSQDQAWQVPLLLCMADAQGVSLGYLLLYMDMGYFLGLYQDVDLGGSGSLHLLSPDGSVIAAMAGGGLLAQQPTQRMASFSKVPEGPGEMELPGPQGSTRLANFHRARYMPLTVVVSRDWNEIRAAHAQNAQRTWAVLGAITALALVGSLLLWRTMQRRQHLFNALEKADQDKQQLIAQLESEKQRALELAASDHLTGLHNRRMFHELVSSHLALARRSRKHYALLYLDLDRFKHINDTLGHHVGDALLQAVAQRLRTMLRSSDIIARMGGDEFAVLITAMEDPSDVETLAQKLLTGLGAPYEGLAPETLHTSPSIGIAFFPRDGHDVEVLCRHADAAMYASKKAGRNRYTYYDGIPKLDSDRYYQLARQLPSAITQEQLVLHFQPKVRLEDCRIVGLEALVRWQHPQYGLIYPGDFIALAEEHGHIEALGDWVMQACCRQIAAWRMQGVETVPIAFNVSPLQLKDSAFPSRMATYLKHYGVRASDIQVEITESCLVEPVGLAARVLHQLQQMGVSIGLDDFGTGFSSLSQIRALPINTIKLDKSFVNELRSSKEAGVLVTSIITLAHNLKMQVVAEGVELMDQLVYLKTAGCDVAQGYFLSRPVPLAQTEALLKQGILEPA